MKPTPQISPKPSRSFPLTDYNYQSTLDAARSVAKEKRAQALRGFWKLGTQFHGAEAVYGDAIDFAVFTVMGVLCAWPIVSVILAISRALNGY